MAAVAALVALALFLWPAGTSGSQPQSAQVGIDDRLPYGQQPVDYLGAETGDAAARLDARLRSGKAKLDFAEKHGYLPSLLKLLDVPVESQLLVFSKTALNPKLVSPQNPRAVYFNDTVAVGWVPGAASLEVVALDRQKGPLFYTLKQNPDGRPRPVREQRCLACHAGTTTLQVPGLMVRSFLTNKDGKPLSGYSRMTHATDLSKRWGGWYVTGTVGSQKHLGNIVGDRQIQRSDQQASDPAASARRSFFDVSKYLSPHSDIVAHLVLEHQAHGLNLLTRVNYEARLNRRSDAEERLVRYLLFADEAPLAEPVQGTSGYREWFERQGPRDSFGRSLRQFDLKTRLFRYRLSYLIYSPLFEGLPEDAKVRVYRNLWEALTGDSDEYRHIAQWEKRAIIQIIRDTKRDLPEHWSRLP